MACLSCRIQNHANDLSDLHTRFSLLVLSENYLHQPAISVKLMHD